MKHQTMTLATHHEDDPGFAGTIHGTTVVINGYAIIIRGPSGSGKSDLALRLADRGAVLLSDDYTHVERRDGGVAAATPPHIAGMIEVRGVGLAELPHVATAPVALIVELLGAADPPPERYPLTQRTMRLCGTDIASVQLHAFECSAPIKVELALKAALKSGQVRGQ